MTHTYTSSLAFTSLRPTFQTRGAAAPCFLRLCLPWPTVFILADNLGQDRKASYIEVAVLEWG